MTDANLALGELDPSGFAGGTIALDAAASHTALASHVGDRLALNTMDAARGMIEIVDENMASAARVHAAERGLDHEGRPRSPLAAGPRFTPHVWPQSLALKESSCRRMPA